MCRVLVHKPGISGAWSVIIHVAALLWHRCRLTAATVWTQQVENSALSPRPVYKLQRHEARHSCVLSAGSIHARHSILKPLKTQEAQGCQGIK